jgi:hypothetical protein
MKGALRCGQCRKALAVGRFCSPACRHQWAGSESYRDFRVRLCPRHVALDQGPAAVEGWYQGWDAALAEDARTGER